MADKNVKAELNAENLEEVAGGALREVEVRPATKEDAMKGGGDYFVMHEKDLVSNKQAPEDEGKKSGKEIDFT